MYFSDLPPALSRSVAFTTSTSPSNKAVYKQKRLAHPLSCLFTNLVLPSTILTNIREEGLAIKEDEDSVEIGDAIRKRCKGGNARQGNL